MNTIKLIMPWQTIEVVDDPYFATVSYEQDNFKKLSMEHWTVKNRTYIDVGAHQGIYTTWMARIAGIHSMVYAFEPNSNNWNLLLKNCGSLMNFCSVAIFPFALGRINGSGRLRCWLNKPASTGQGQLISGDNSDSIVDVRVVSLDTIQFPFKVEFIKIDAEHFEWEVISGAINTILTHRPRMLIEIHSDNNKNQIQSFCKEHHFSCEEWRAGVPEIGQMSDFLFIRP